MNYNTIRALRAMGYPDSLLKRAAVNVQSYSFTSVAGITNQNLQVPGNSRALLGILIVNENVNRTDKFNLNVNNEKVMQDTSAVIADPNAYSLAQDGYLGCYRVLSGKDVLTMDYSSIAGGSNVTVNIFYLTA